MVSHRNPAETRLFYSQCLARKREQLREELRPINLVKMESSQRISDIREDIRNYLLLLGIDAEEQAWLDRVKNYLAYLSTWNPEDLRNMIATPSLGPAIIVDDDRITRELRERERGN